MTNSGSDTVSVIDGNTSRRQDVTVDSDPNDVSVNPNTNMIYVANRDSNTISVIDGNTNSVVKNITVGQDPRLCLSIQIQI